VNQEAIRIIQGIPFRTKNESELAAYRSLSEDGYSVLRRGWPDLLAVDGNGLRFIEVKDNHGRLKPQQLAVAMLLSDLGIETEVWARGDPKRSRTWAADIRT
jgi:hypothetical protein